MKTWHWSVTCIGVFVVGIILGSLMVGTHYHFKEQERKQQSQQLLDLIQGKRR